ncbi:hypothetical protein HYW42_05420 [Candidatus Daviesbacteria bacterium]|nr:hypothetical protein [Candidatus Daviesbacteria bacterium]
MDRYSCSFNTNPRVLAHGGVWVGLESQKAIIPSMGVRVSDAVEQVMQRLGMENTRKWSILSAVTKTWEGRYYHQ